MCAGGEHGIGPWSKMNQRKYVRYPKKFRCWCEGNGVTVFARVANVSEDGLFLNTSTPLDPGSLAKVKFVGIPFSVTARVVWVKAPSPQEPGGMGLHFEPVDAPTHESILRLIEAEK